jgi:hypothetical protein
MKRPVVLAVCFLIAVAAVFGLAKGIPFVCNAIEMDRHARKALLREPAAEQDWRRELGDPATTLSAFPRREDSESATRLIELARSVGIDMARARRVRHLRASPIPPERWPNPSETMGMQN